MMTTLGPTILQDFQSYTSVNGRVYLPDLSNNTTNGRAEFYVRNDGTEPRNVLIYYFNANGTPTPKLYDTCVLNPNQQCWIPVNEFNRIPDGTTGSAFVDGGEAVSIVAETRNATLGLGYAYTGRTVPTATLYLPETIDLYPWLMHFRVLNTGPAAADITSRFITPGGTLRPAQTVGGVPANGLSQVFPLLDLAPQNDYYGTGRVSTAVQPLATTVHISDTTHRRLGYSGLSASDTTVWLPFVMTRLANDWGTTLWAQNTSTTGTTVYVDFYDENQPSPRLTISQPVNGRGLALFNLRTNDYGLGWGWYGSARVRASQRLAVVVNQLKDDQTLGASYEGIPALAGTNIVVLPRVARAASNCYYSNFTVRNLGSAEAAITIYYYEPSGAQATSPSTDSVASHRVYNLKTLTPPGHTFPPTGFIGTVKIVSTNNQPIAATSNLLDYCGSSPTDTVSFTGVNR